MNANIKILLIIILSALTACKATKFRELELDYTQNLIGKVKRMDIALERKYKNTTCLDSIIVYYDKRKNIIKQKELNIDNHINLQQGYTETDFFYDNNLLAKQIYKANDTTIYILAYKYDKKGNLSDYQMYENNLLLSHKTNLYDKNNNIIQQNDLIKGTVSKYNINYDSNIVELKAFDKDNKLRSSALRTYNDKGWIIKSIINNNSKFCYNLNYDDKGNLITKTDCSIPADTIEYYKNKYDKIGNIIQRDRYVNGEIRESTKIKITYW